MRLKRLFPFILVLAVGCRTLSAERSIAGKTAGTNPVISSPAANAEEGASEVIPNEQIDLNRTVLLTYSDEAQRILAANLLLFDTNPYARKVLIQTLNLTNNSPARIAICKALIQTRTTQKEIPDKDDFIEPLLNIFSTKVDEEARLAADAVLIYNYQKIGSLLDKIVTDPEKPARTRINVIEALKKVWEKQAIIRLYRLVDDPDQDVAAEAANALHSLGFQPGANSSERAKTIADIQNREIVEVLRNLLINQDKQINELKTKLDSLEDFVLTILEGAYQGIGVDDASKGKFLKTYLADPRPWVKSWALDKVLIWRKTPLSSIPADLEPVIINLVSDPSVEIRLKTIDLIGLLQPMRTVDLSTKLLAQFEVEQDDQVKNELLDKLGIVCSTALSPTAQIKITADTRQRVLAYASDYLSRDDPAKAKIGAKVMRQLLEREGMQEQDIKTYLGLLAGRFNRQAEDPNNTLLAELLNQMVGLTADSSASREYARKAFEPFFTKALNYDNDFIRETAIDGLGYVNKANALKILRDRVSKERSEKARLKIIKFAEDVGGRDDLDWLAKRLGPGTNSEPKQAWAAMVKIFNSMEIEALSDWEIQLISPGSIYNLSELQKIEFLKKVLAKTPAKNKQKYYEQIANRSLNTEQYEQAVNYFALFYDAAPNTEEKDRILPKFLDACLRMPNLKRLEQLIKYYLSNNDFTPDNSVAATIDNYFKDANIVSDKNTVLNSLKEIKLAQLKPGWQAQLREWTDLINKTEPEKPPVSVQDN